jgi:DNA-binding response OmpR family regulator
MNTRPLILLVEDEDFAASLAAGILSPDYDVQRARNGQDALNSISQKRPDLVLLDVGMPGMSGYDVCKALRSDAEDPALGALPIIFLSGRVDDADRLAGYEAGGDDYLTKPVSADELRSKIRLVLANCDERQRLRKDLSSASSMAMTAMSGAAEVGVLLHFMRMSFGCPNYAELCREVLRALASYDLEASVQIRGQQETVSLNQYGVCSPLESSVLTNISRQERLFAFGSRTCCSYEHITIIVKNNSRDDPRLHGRMNDNIALLAEGADARVIALDSSAATDRQRATLMLLTVNTRKALQGIDRRHRHQGLRNSQIFLDLQENFERSILTLGITNSQEAELAEMLEDAADRARALYDEGLEIDGHMTQILEQLEAAGNA